MLREEYARSRDALLKDWAFLCGSLVAALVAGAWIAHALGP
jgi:hypothetical protein